MREERDELQAQLMSVQLTEGRHLVTVGGASAQLAAGQEMAALSREEVHFNVVMAIRLICTLAVHVSHPVKLFVCVCTAVRGAHDWLEGDCDTAAVHREADTPHPGQASFAT